MEEIPDGRISPSTATYFYPGGQLMSHVNWKNSYYVHLDPQGKLQEMLHRDSYQAFENGEEVIDCLQSRCLSTRLTFLSIPKQGLQTGDVIFSGDLSPYTGLRKAELTHVSIFAGFRSGIPYVVSSDMYEPPALSPMDSVLYNTFSYVILRNPKFQRNFQDYMDGKKRHLEKTQAFCSLLFFSLFQETFENTGAKWPYFERILPEYLLKNTFEYFELVAAHTPHFESVEEMIQKRETQLESQSLTWTRMISEPRETLYQMFLRRFPFLPLEFSENKVENLLRLTASGLFQASRKFTMTNGKKSPGAFSPLPQTTQLFDDDPSFKCFQRENSPRLCTMRNAAGRTRLVEIYTDGGSCPDTGIYLRPDGTLRTYIDWKREVYLSLQSNGEPGEILMGKKYKYLEEGQTVTICDEISCQSKNLKFLSIPQSGLQTGDVIFSANLYPYSGRARSWLTHVEIFYGYQKEIPMVLTNDIYEKLSIRPLGSAHQNTFGYAIARNPQFQRAFKDALEKVKPLTLIPVPYFCANLFVELYSRIYPEKTEHWDQVDRNFAEQIFLNTIDDFEILSMNLGSLLSIDQFREKRKPVIAGIRQKISKIMEEPHTFLEQLFAQDFPMLPNIFNQRLVHRILQMMKIHHPWKLSHQLGWKLEKETLKE